MPIDTVEHVEKAAAMSPVDELAWLPAPFCIHQHGNLRGIPIVHVMRHELEIPFQFAGVRVESDRAIRVQVVTPPRVAVPIGRGVSRAPNDKVLLHIERSCHPCRSPACLPRGTRPGLASRLSRLRYGPEAPTPLARGRIVCIQEPA